MWTLFSHALKLPEWFLSTQLLCMQLGAEFLVEFRVMLIYRTCRGVVTHLSSVNVWMLTPEYEYFQVACQWVSRDAFLDLGAGVPEAKELLSHATEP